MLLEIALDRFHDDFTNQTHDRAKRSHSLLQIGQQAFDVVVLDGYVYGDSSHFSPSERD
jgi:hypothetical protein